MRFTFSPLGAIRACIEAFRDPRRRPRAVIITGLGTIFLILFTVGSLVGTSFEWFCTTPCHMVHDDNTVAYKNSSHSNISCMACHEPVNASPLTFVMMKIHVLPDVPATIFNTYHAPNLTSRLAAKMPSEQCTQCHAMDNRTVSPSLSLIIDHKVHEKNGVTCTMCHNRVAHNDDAITEFVVRGNRAHDNWMTMDACFRCHDLEKPQAPTGACASCHPSDFDLVPSTHAAQGWYERFGDSSGHAKAAREESAAIAAAHERNAEASKGGHGGGGGTELTPSSEVNSCYTCHKQSFCGDCHKTEMPHPEAFKTDHSTQGYENPAVCAECHARTPAEAKGTQFCSACHHPSNRPGRSWVSYHKATVNETGAEPCFKCHKPESCSKCHVETSMRGLR